MSNSPKNNPENSPIIQVKKASNTINISREQIIQEIDEIKVLIVQHGVILGDKHMLGRNEVEYKKRVEEIMNELDGDYTAINGSLVRRNVIDTTNIHDYGLRVFAYEKSHIIQMCNLINPQLNKKAKEEYFHVELNMTSDIFYVMHSPKYMRMKGDCFEIFDYNTGAWNPTTAKKFFDLYQETLMLILKTTHFLIDEKLTKEIKTLIQ